MRRSLIGWLAGGLSTAERSDLATKFAPTSSAWVTAFIRNSLDGPECKQLVQDLTPDDVDFSLELLRSRVLSVNKSLTPADSAKLSKFLGDTLTKTDLQKIVDDLSSSTGVKAKESVPKAEIPVPDAKWTYGFVSNQLPASERSQLLDQLVTTDNDFVPSYVRSKMSQPVRKKLAVDLAAAELEDDAAYHDTLLPKIVATNPSKALSFLREQDQDYNDFLAAQREALEKAEVEVDTKAESVPEQHPVFGVLLHRSSNKSLYATKLSSLTDSKLMPVWEHQRSYRQERAEQIAKAKAKAQIKDGVSLFPGVITVYEAPHGEAGEMKHAILDGQHRVGAMGILLEKGLVSGENSVTIEVHRLERAELAADLFTEINQAQPVKLVDMPGVTDAKTRVALEGASTMLKDRFQTMFRPSANCRPPHLNLDVLKDKLFQADVMLRFELTTQKQIFDWMITKNAELEAMSDEEWYARYDTSKRSAAKQTTFKKALEKARGNGLYLGLDWRWLD